MTRPEGKRKERRKKPGKAEKGEVAVFGREKQEKKVNIGRYKKTTTRRNVKVKGQKR